LLNEGGGWVLKLAAGRTGQARRQHAAAAVGDEREAVVAVGREQVRRMGRMRGRGVCFVAIS